ncbi:MAG: NAD(P)-dependent glycerol-3-phosphate dehydrogenase [Deltaproteobacteria bacterium]|jgi:glycerol-3-phosphate dehydrogenase (NAD(P)+)|nr:NAD(P)-dependent glycerol-3-phosphate dehydrogenase [Deltaproteobacteria bacterium]
MSGKKSLRVMVAGGGSWGTALAHVLACGGHEVLLWARDAAVVEAVNARHENPRYLPGRVLHEGLRAPGDTTLFAERELMLLAVPCQQMREFLGRVRTHFAPGLVLVNASKGIELVSRLRMSSLMRELLPPLAYNYVMLSGPSFAAEVLDGQPTAVVLACEEEALGAHLRQAFSTPVFRCYSSTDVCGVELGGAVKNVMAIAAGLCDGLGLGHNSRGALITRGLAEISRLGVALGARPGTFMGLSGLGDLVLSCTGDLSRNRRVGLALAGGGELEEIVRNLGSTAEGVQTTFAVHSLGREYGVETPITDAVHSILQGSRTPRQAIRELMLRNLREE